MLCARVRVIVRACDPMGSRARARGIGSARACEGVRAYINARTLPHALALSVPRARARGPMGSHARTITRTRAHNIAALYIIIYKDAAK